MLRNTAAALEMLPEIPDAPEAGVHGSRVN